MICQRCGAETSNAICSECGFINDPESATYSYQSTESTDYSYQDTDSSYEYYGGGYTTNAFVAYEDYAQTSKGAKFLDLSSKLTLTFACLIGATLAIALLVVLFAAPHTIALIASYISASIIAFLGSLTILSFAIDPIVQAVSMRAYCVKNGLTLEKPEPLTLEGTFKNDNEKNKEQIKINLINKKATLMYNAYLLSTSTKNLVVHCIFIPIEASLASGALSAIAAVPITLYSVSAIKMAVSSQALAFIVYIAVAIVAALLMYGILMGILTIFTKIINAIKKAIIGE